MRQTVRMSALMFFCRLTRCTRRPNSRLVAAGSLDGTVYLWNAQNGKVERTMREHGYVASKRHVCTGRLDFPALRALLVVGGR